MGAPVKSIFVCGGTTPNHAPDDWTRRDTLFRIIDGEERAKYEAGLDKHYYTKAEGIDGFLFRDHYKDWLTLELDIARISEVTLLFCESPGAFAELGAFATDSEIAQSLLVIIDYDKYQLNGFIRHGLLKYLEDTYSAASVYVLQVNEMGLISRSMKGSDIDTDRFALAVGQALDLRLKEPLGHRTFNPNMSGHRIKFVTGLVQEYGALTLNEIEYIFASIDIDVTDDDLNRYLFCAETMGWLKKDRRGYEVYFTSTSATRCLTYLSRPDGPVVDRRRWRADIRDYWKAHDEQRFASIVSCYGAGA
ncbi:retron St85 family effector protein [Brevundimonas naejangsanensis]|uniref:retron St85 family effector protein n=1 Tax=Brevundimonas naejangsanensis TaxID=588932 RepID=UPI0026EF4DCE|nr:retron St85 family effector protein [Brevundimonas naejangsanensis]